ncbi:MAG: PLD nuclease N-terminal domain-containing protein [Vagococcus salmoninarum]
MDGPSNFKAKQFFLLNRALWLIIVLFLQFFGPVAYLVFGKKEKL